MTSYADLPFNKNHPLYAEAQAFDESMDVTRKARGKPTRAEIHAMGVGTPEYNAAVEDLLRDRLIALGGDPDEMPDDWDE